MRWPQFVIVVLILAAVGAALMTAPYGATP